MKHNPDKWEIIKFEGEEATWYKVLGSFYGGYASGNSWRLSSGLEEVTEEGDYYLMKNHSGSIYKCHKNGRGINAPAASIYSSLIELGNDEDIEVSIISLEDYIEENGGI